MAKFAPAVFAVPLLLATLPANAVEPGAPERLISHEEVIGIKARESFAGLTDGTKKFWRGARLSVDKFYAARDNRPIWINSGKLNERALEIIGEIENASDYGLARKDFRFPDLPAASEPASAETLARAEATLTREVLKYALYAKGGRIEPTELSGFLDRSPVPPDPEEVLSGLTSATDSAAFLRALHPRHPQFEALRQKYLSLRGDRPSYEDVRIPSGPTLKLGVRHPQVALLRQRLDTNVLDNHHGVAETPPELFDNALADSVRRFQKDRGLKADGIVGSNTRRHLNAKDGDKVQRILVNMERWRWMPEDLGSIYVWANIPEFRVRVVKNDEVIHAERLVAGKVQNQTPIFSDEMERIEFYPFWNVPDSIKVKEILPSLRRSTRILARQNLKIKYRGRKIDPASVNWSSVDIRRFHFYQPPGGRNALGFVKFMFPNKHAVYMHDTPSKSLFGRSIRTFSHGCMRIRNPRRLAEILLAHDKGWSPKRIGNLIAAGEHYPVHLNQKIPVHVTYFTASVSSSGRLVFRGDFYGHDRRIALALNGKTLRLSHGYTKPAAERVRTRVATTGNSDVRRSWSQDPFTNRN